MDLIAPDGWLPGAVMKRREVESWLEAEQVRRNALAFEAAAKTEAEQLHQRESERGFEEGLEQGRRQGAMEAQEALEALAEETRQKLASINADLMTIVADCVGEIIGALDHDERLSRVVGHALSNLADTHGLTLRAAPDLSLDLLRRLALEATPVGSEPVDVMTDMALAPSQMRLTGDDRFINISSDAQLQALRRSLEEERGDGGTA
jgi:type III secretion protein L